MAALSRQLLVCGLTGTWSCVLSIPWSTCTVACTCCHQMLVWTSRTCTDYTKKMYWHLQISIVIDCDYPARRNVFTDYICAAGTCGSVDGVHSAACKSESAVQSTCVICVLALSVCWNQLRQLMCTAFLHSLVHTTHPPTSCCATGQTSQPAYTTITVKTSSLCLDPAWLAFV